MIELETLSLRQLLWLYHGHTYQTLMVECSGIAGVWNSQRTHKTDRVWLFTDFHPAHLAAAAEVKPKTGREIIRGIACWFGDEIQWAEGYGPERI